jgi:hypothetical protein
MRKLLLLLSALALAVFIIGTVRARAEEEETDKVVCSGVESVSGEVGDKVDVPILLSDCETVDSVEFDLNYDSAALSVVSVTPGDLFPAEYCVSNTDTPGCVSIACCCELGLEGDGTLLTVRFEILTATGSALTITTHKTGERAEEVVSYIDEDYNQYFSYVSLTNGAVTVGTAAAPDPLVTPWAPATPTPSLLAA